MAVGSASDDGTGSSIDFHRRDEHAHLIASSIK
jgi:hypothetical protein